MIYCPKCGTANRDGSKFCNECGQDLSAAFEPMETPSAPVAGDEAGSVPSSMEIGGEPVPEWLQRLQALLPEELREPVSLEKPREGLEAIPPPAEEPEAVEEAPPVEEVAPPPEEAEVPDWLREWHAAPEEEPPTVEEFAPPVEEVAPPPEEAEVPDWLQELRAAPEEVPLAVEEEAPPVKEVALPPEEAEVPDWVRELRAAPEEVPSAVEEEAPPVEEVAPPPEEAEVPDWLRELQAAPEEAPPTVEEVAPPVEEVTPPPEEAEVPDWLRELRAAPEEVPSAVEEEVPLVEKVPSAVEEEAPPVEEVTAPVEEAEVPDWLRELQAAPEEAPPVVEEEVEVPAWLAEMRPPTLPAEEEVELPAAEAPPSLEEVELPEGEIPPWLEGFPQPEVEAELLPAEEAPLPSPVEEEEAAPPLEAAPVEEALAPAEIPTWLQSLRPPEVSEAVPEEIPAAEAIETKGLLAGIKGILPVEPIISAPHTFKAPLVSAPAAVGPEQAGLFEEIVTKRPLAPVEVEVRRRARILRVDPRWFIYLIVALAVVLPLLSQGQWFDSHDVIVTEAAGEVYEAIQALPEGAMVLVAYDYDPSLAAEMGLQAEAILHHLMDRNLRVMALSLYPSGSEIAQETMDKVAAKHGYLYGKDYVNLGYLAGREAALRGFGLNPLGTAKVDYRDHKSLNTLPVMKDFLPDQGIQNIAMIVELAGGQDALQGWIEQVVSPHKDKVKMVAGVTASIQPFAMPYRDSGQLLGLISGPTGAAEYEVKAGRPSSAVDNLDSQSVTLLVVIILMLVGNMEYLVTRLRGGG